MRNHHEDGWLTAAWTHLRTQPVPFGESAWRHARIALAQRGRDQATEAEIAQAADELYRAAQGPPANSAESKKDRRVAGRTRATATPMWPRPDATEPDCEDDLPQAEDDETGETGQVIPLPVFDARKEAESWRL